MTGRSMLGAARGVLFPGFDRVHSQVEPFARAWQAANSDALLQDGPLWVALGDSMSQGIGAQDISGARRNPQALAINALIDDAAKTGRVRVADMRGRNLASLRGTRADDHFHPNERGYATVTREFAAAIGLGPPPG